MIGTRSGINWTAAGKLPVCRIPCQGVMEEIPNLEETQFRELAGADLCSIPADSPLIALDYFRAMLVIVNGELPVVKNKIYVNIII